MGRQPRKQAIPAQELLNFHFSTPAVSESSAYSARQGNPSHHHRNSRRQNKQQYYRTAQDRASARKRANSANFYLHSSPDHSFAITRQSNSKVQGGPAYSFSGSNSPVSWESVRIVKHMVPVDNQNPTEEIACPICLCEYTCPRVTKCGHSFCLACILHHVQSHTATNYAIVKCPCCSIPLSVVDLRPVIFQRTIPPKPQNFISLRKLHRQKGCSAPYIPLPNEPKRSNPHTAPCQSDPDAPFSRFNYVDPVQLRSLLEENRCSLVREMKTTPPDAFDYSFLAMAIEIVANEEREATVEITEELSLQERFWSETSGMYQRQSPALVYYRHSEEQPTQNPADVRSSEQGPSSEEVAPIDNSSPVTGRDRGESIGSYKSVKSCESVSSNKSFNSEGKGGHGRMEGGAMYLDDSDAVHFYQAEDGRPIFLNGFNMACLCTDFSKTRPTEEIAKPPLPDFLSGRILEVEYVHLTPDVRKRMPFLEHIPVYSDIQIVELDLNNVLSKETKRIFQADMAKRKKKRQSKIQAEKRADREAKQEEARLINDRKSRFQMIDQDDEFFHAPSSEVEAVSSHDTEIDPDLGTGDPSVVDVPSVSPRFQPGPSQNFLDACRRAGNPLQLESEASFPGLQRVSDAFPALGVSPTKTPSTKKVFPGTEALESSSLGQTGKKKGGKGKKVMLFSTGGQRGYT